VRKSSRVHAELSLFTNAEKTNTGENRRTTIVSLKHKLLLMSDCLLKFFAFQASLNKKKKGKKKGEKSFSSKREKHSI
jgi:hypothetical protein